EIRLSGDTNGIKWVGGLFYYEDERDADGGFIITAPVLNADHLLSQNSTGEATTESKAVFAQVDIPFASQFTAVLGARYTREDRELNDFNNVGPTGLPLLCAGDTTGAACPKVSNFNADISTNKPTYKAGVEWRPSDDVLTYLQYTSGFKSGSFGTSIPGNVAAIGPVGAEEVDAWELGAKTTW